jgi:pimeloyl-[acyl-carrier protein] synthase
VSNKVDFNPMSPEFQADPYPTYRRLREEEPVHVSPFGVWIITRYDDVIAVLRDRRCGRQGIARLLDARLGLGPGNGTYARDMFYSDPPDHTRLRSLLSRAFSSRIVEAMRPRVQALVDQILDRVEDTHRIELIDELAYPLPVTVICEMLGVPTGDQRALERLCADVAASFDAPARSPTISRGREARLKLEEYFRSLVSVRRMDQRPDLLSSLIAAEEQGDKLNGEELISMCILLLLTGHQDSTNAIGSSILTLLQHPTAIEELRHDPELIPSAVEELLRYESPTQRTARMTTADIELGGERIPKGSVVAAVIGAANRDPAQFEDPERLDLRRVDNRHIAFSYGIHFCMGSALARIEVQITISTLLRRFPRLALASNKPDWHPSSWMRGLKRLPLTF